MYGTVELGDAFFASRLHKYDWEVSSPADKAAALNQAAELIDQFNYAGQKTPVQALYDALPSGQYPTDAEIKAASATQPHEFPRGTDTEVPEDIKKAAYLIAMALLGGRDPNADLENRTMKASRIGQLMTQFDTEGNTQEHIAHLIPSPQAFNLIRPYFRPRDEFTLLRV
jgi:hypothetical protein